MNDRGLGGMLSRRELLLRAAGAAAIATGPFPAPAVARAAQADQSGDLALVNGRFVDGRGMVARAITIGTAASRASAQAGPLAPDAATIDLGGRTVIPGLFDAHVHYTRAGSIRATRRGGSSAPSRSRSCRRRLRGAPPRRRRVRSSRASADGTTRSSRRTAARRKPSSMPQRRRTASTSREPAAAQARSPTASARRFSRARGVMVDDATGWWRRQQPPSPRSRPLQTADDKLRGTARHERARQQPRADRRDQCRQPRGPGVCAPLWRQERLTIRMRPLFPADSPSRSRRACPTTSVRAAAPSATTCSGSQDSASASAATTRCRRRSSRRLA